MTEIILTTLNARYIHTAFGLRYLLANLHEFQQRTKIVELEIKTPLFNILEKLLIPEVKIIGFGVYIWNVEQITKVVAAIKAVRPEIIIVLGGPEVSHDREGLLIADLADYIIVGEGEDAFYQLCSDIFANQPPTSKILSSPLPDLTTLQYPYDFYTDEDIAHRVCYVEASRGCPFRCEFCLSSLDKKVRKFPLDSFLTEMKKLLDRGVLHFKFVDRTFNLNIKSTRTILQFFLKHYREGLFLHFEMVPDHFPQALREDIEKFPPGALQFEVGVQTFNPEVAQRINRKQNYEKLEDNLRFLREKTHVHVHADLIIGLPGEDLESFEQGFNRMLSLKPQEIQVGILKKLRGTTLKRHDDTWGMSYNPNPPYDLLQNDFIPFSEMQRMKRFARYWDLIGNSGNFLETLPLLLKMNPSPFQAFLHFSDWLYAKEQRIFNIALEVLVKDLFEYLSTVAQIPPTTLAPLFWKDHLRGHRVRIPKFLKPYISKEQLAQTTRRKHGHHRQERHLQIK